MKALLKAKINLFLDEVSRYYPRISCLQEEWPEYFERFPEDLNIQIDLSMVSDQCEDIYDALSEHYERKFQETAKRFKTILKLIEENFKRDGDFNEFISTMLYIIKELDPYFDALGSGTYEYHEPMADLIIDVLNNTDKETVDKFLAQITQDYLDPSNKDMYTFTFGIVINELLGKRKFNQLYHDRIQMELENFDLSDYMQYFYQKQLEYLNEELSN